MKGRPRPAAFRFGRGALRKIFLPYPRAAVRMRGRVCAKSAGNRIYEILADGVFSDNMGIREEGRTPREWGRGKPPGRSGEGAVIGGILVIERPSRR